MNVQTRRYGIRQRLALLVILPVIVLAVITAGWVLDRSREVSQAQEAIDATDAALGIDALANAIQDERAISLDGFSTESDLQAVRDIVDGALIQVDELVGSGTAPASLAGVLTDVRAQLDGTRAAIGTDPATVGPTLADELRSQTDPAAPGPVTSALLGYGQSVQGVVATGASAVASVSDTDLALRLEASSLLSLVKETYALEALTINQALITDGWSNPALALFFQSWVSAHDAYSSTLTSLSIPEVGTAFDSIMANASSVTVLDGRAAAISGFTQGSLPIINVSEYQAASQRHLGDLNDLSAMLAANTSSRADDLKSDARRDQMLVLSILGVITIGLILAGRRIYRSVVDPVVALTQAASHVAQVGLPATIEAYEHLGAGEEPPPVEAIARSSDDEIGDLVHAFNDLHASAIRLAGEQAVSRRNVGEMFVNLGRRSQKLTARQLSFLTELEKQETDADTLENLFRLDSLATRMRRNAESLLVLAGAPSSRRYTNPASVGDVLRGATSEVEQYRRVSIEMRDHVRISADAIADITHMFAELIENALEFSGPDTTVEVVGKADLNGFIVAVSDHGIGMSDEELEGANERIASAPPLDRAPTRFLGLLVVGRLAERHGIRAKLIRRPDGGVTAVVVLPVTVLADELPAAAAPEVPSVIEPPAVAMADGTVLADAPGPAVPSNPVPMRPVAASDDRPPLPARSRTDDDEDERAPAVEPNRGLEPTTAREPVGAASTPSIDDVWPAAGDGWPVAPDVWGVETYAEGEPTPIEAVPSPEPAERASSFLRVPPGVANQIVPPYQPSGEPGPDRFLAPRAAAASTRELFERALRQPQPITPDEPGPTHPTTNPLSAFQAGVRRGEADAAAASTSSVEDPAPDDDPWRNQR